MSSAPYSMSSADWQQLYDRYYRKQEFYELRWGDMALDQYHVAIAPYGGPIALLPDERAIQFDTYNAMLTDKEKEQRKRAKLRIYTAAGSLISETYWQHASLIKMGWNSSEQLICVLNDGNVHIYSMKGERISTFSLPAACRTDGVADCIIWSEGLVVRTGGRSELFAVLNFADPRPVRLADPQLNAPPLCMCLLNAARTDPTDPSSSTQLEIMLATNSGSIVIADQKQAIDMQVNSGPFAKMIVSPNGKLVAAFSIDGTLHIFHSEFDKNLSKFGTNSKVPPLDMCWCGDDAVVLYWENILLLVGLYGDFIKYSYDGALALFSEKDGVRIFSEEKHEFLHLVDESTEAIFKLGSESSAAKLFDASDAYDKKNGNAAEYLRQIEAIEEKEGKNSKNGMKAAIEACLTAARNELSLTGQQLLLRSAAYGKLFCPQFQADIFVDTCRILRVMNAIRALDIGMPMTTTQFDVLGGELLVERLMSRNLHLLAFRVCKYLQMDIDNVLVHWACAKIKASADDTDDDDYGNTSTSHEGGHGRKGYLSDEKLAELIITKVKLKPGISFAPIATTAYRHGRRALATLLLDYEPLTSNAVPLLLSMKEEELAIDKAIASGDTDLVYMAMLQIKKTRPLKEFFALIKDRPLARNLYISYCKQTDLQALKTFFYALQNPVEAANIAVLEAYQCTELDDRLSALKIANEFYEKDKNNVFMARATEEQIKLSMIERDHDLNLPPNSSQGVRTVDFSVTEMMQYYISENDRKRASKLQSTFKISESRMWHLDVRTLAKNNQWDELWKLVQSLKKPPPIGYLPFIEVCIEAKKYTEAVKYIERLTDHRAQIEWLCNINYWKEAADVAAKARDAEALQVIRGSCRNAQISAYIEKLLGSLPQ
jgi:WD40 repeat protein